MYFKKTIGMKSFDVHILTVEGWKMVKKILCSIFALVLCLAACGMLGGCGAKDVNDYLAEANYDEAYNVAKTDEQKNLAKAEYTIAYLCELCKIDAFGGEEIDFNLQATWFANGENLADSLAGYRYYLLKIIFDDTQVAYVLYNYDEEERVLNNMFNTLSLEAETSDDAFSGFKKELCKWIMDSAESYRLESQSLDRVNKLITDDSLKKIELSIDLLF